jgi:hypothetical protein
MKGMKPILKRVFFMAIWTVSFSVASFFLCTLAVGLFCGLRIGARADYNTTLQISNWVFVHPYISADIGAILALILSIFGKLPGTRPTWRILN